MKTKLILPLLPLLLLSFSAHASDSALCASNSPNQLSFAGQSLAPRSSGEFSLITWNAHKLEDDNFIPDLRQLSQDADLLLVQEAMNSPELQYRFQSDFDFSFSFFKSFCDLEDHATGVMTGSRYPLAVNRTLVSPGTEPVIFTHKVAGYSQIQVPGIGLIHVINTHALNFNLGFKFESQMDQIADFISHLQGPVIWAGDFNTWNFIRTDYLNAKAAALKMTHLQPDHDSRNLKLDQIYVRGLQIISSSVMNQYKSSDHLPIKAVFRKN